MARARKAGDRPTAGERRIEHYDHSRWISCDTSRVAVTAGEERLCDDPYADASRVRVTGPFTVEAVPAPTVGQPDVEVRSVAKGEHAGNLEVEVQGFDYYNTKTSQIESGDTRRIALWMLDADDDGRSLFPRQVFVPARLARDLRAEIDEERIEASRGTVSLPFGPGPHPRVAVKIVDDRGIESLEIIPVS